MKKLYGKLILSVLTVLFTITVVLTASYAWLTVSKSPMASNIQVTIAGGNTIMIAPDVTETVDGQIVHYPGEFDDHINFANAEGYEYLSQLCGLIPVSTDNGIDWINPTYYNSTDDIVKEKKVFSGTIRPISEFESDDTLRYANLTGEADAPGSYVCLDFWVVSPGMDYDLRVSCGSAETGSFVLARPVVDEQSGDLVPSDRAAATSIRLGFLVNDISPSSAAFVAYQSSDTYSQRYAKLVGSFPEAGTGYDETTRAKTEFSVYEPNADLHVEPRNDGDFLYTAPLGLQNGGISETSYRGTYAVQKASSLVGAVQTGAVNGSILEQMYQAYQASHDTEGMSPAQIERGFYDNYLQGQLGIYAARGDFFSRTSDLYALALTTHRAEAEDLAEIQTGGATDDAIIVPLERNVPQHIRMFLWLEGQDADCVNPCGTNTFCVELELAGSNT